MLLLLMTKAECMAGVGTRYLLLADPLAGLLANSLTCLRTHSLAVSIGWVVRTTTPSYHASLL